MEKIKAVGITAEYNPFHNGHLFHIEESRKMTGADVVVVAMSGNFVQRGQAAVCDKWMRAEAAVKSGADLVVEIPTVFACNSAPVFGTAAVEILSSLGVDCISFGSESGNIEDLAEISRVIMERTEEIREIVDEKTKDGLSYPRARREAIAQLVGEDKAELLDSPNNVLAIEYLKALGTIGPETGKKPEAVTVTRKGAGYNDMEAFDDIASATAIRYMVEERMDVSSLVPLASLGRLEYVLDRKQWPSDETLFKMICQKVLTTEAETLDSVFAGGEGLGNKIKNIIRKVSSLDELAEGLKSKRYTRTRIDRFLVQLLLDIKAPENYANYIRVLAMNEKGAKYLKQVKKEELSSLPIITNINKEGENYPEIEAAVEKDILATDLYNLITGRDLYSNSDFVKFPVMVL